MERIGVHLRGGAASRLEMQYNTGTQLLVKILQERKKADGAVGVGADNIS